MGDSSHWGTGVDDTFHQEKEEEGKEEEKEDEREEGRGEEVEEEEEEEEEREKLDKQLNSALEKIEDITSERKRKKAKASKFSQNLFFKRNL
jgi:molecular chaperone GrpE (heat shock protein)